MGAERIRVSPTHLLDLILLGMVAGGHKHLGGGHGRGIPATHPPAHAPSGRIPHGRHIGLLLLEVLVLLHHGDVVAVAVEPAPAAAAAPLLLRLLLLLRLSLALRPEVLLLPPAVASAPSSLTEPHRAAAPIAPSAWPASRRLGVRRRTIGNNDHIYSQ
jgi:hypothetical protein